MNLARRISEWIASGRPEHIEVEPEEPEEETEEQPEKRKKPPSYDDYWFPKEGGLASGNRGPRWH